MSNRIRDTITDTLNKRGVRSKTQSERALNYIGRASRVTFMKQVDNMYAQISPGNLVVVALGQIYERGTYKITGGDEKTYEEVYEDLDWTVAAADPGVKKALADAVGDNDNDPTGDRASFTQEQLRATLGQNSTVPNKRGTKEKHRTVFEAQTIGVGIPDESADGIRSVEDFDAPIDPIA